MIRSSFSSVVTIATLLAIVSALTGCADTKKIEPVPRISGYECLPIPSEFNEPGSMFSVDDNGTPYRLGAVEDIKVTEPKNAGFPKYTSNSSNSLGFALSFLEGLKKKTNISADIDGQLLNTIQTTASYSDIKLIATEGQPETTAIVWFKKMGYRIEDGMRYFLVREAIAAKGIDYRISDTDVNKLGGQAVLNDLAKGEFTLADGENKKSYILTATFEPRVNVCIKTRELTTLSSGSAGLQTLEFQNPGSKINITEHR